MRSKPKNTHVRGQDELIAEDQFAPVLILLVSEGASCTWYLSHISPENIWSMCYTGKEVESIEVWKPSVLGARHSTALVGHVGTDKLRPLIRMWRTV